MTRTLFSFYNFVDGNYAESKLTEGRIALFNMWNYELSLSELILIDCTTKGQLLSMSEMSIRGPANYSEEDIPCSETGKPKKSSEYKSKLRGVL